MFLPPGDQVQVGNTRVSVKQNRAAMPYVKNLLASKLAVSFTIFSIDFVLGHELARVVRLMPYDKI